MRVRMEDETPGFNLGNVRTNLSIIRSRFEASAMKILWKQALKWHTLGTTVEVTKYCKE